MSYESGGIVDALRTGSYALKGFHSTSNRIEPSGARQVSGGQKLVFRLPTNDLLDAHSFKVYCKAKTSGDNADSTKTVRFPNNICTLIEKVEVRASGVQVDGNSTTNSGYIANICKNITCDHDARQEKNVSARELIDNAFLNAGIDDTGNEYLCMNYFPGFLHECKPRIIDASIMPALDVHITFKSADQVLQKEGDPGNVSYTLSDCFATINVHHMENSAYSQLMGLSSQDVMTIPYYSYVSYEIDTPSNTNTQGVDSQSVNELFATFIPKNELQKIQGYNLEEYSTDGSSTTTYKKYIAGANRMTNAPEVDAQNKSLPSLNGISSWQFKVNSAMLPSYECNPIESYEFLKNAGYRVPCKTRQDFYATNWVAYYNLTVPGSDPLRVKSGLDTRGVQSNITFKTQGGSKNNYTLFMMARTTRELNIAEGMQVDVVE
jgi:hypothetical protein